jgi:hypothetical protein
MSSHKWTKWTPWTERGHYVDIEKREAKGGMGEHLPK